MISDKERIATLLTGLDTAIEMSETLLAHGDRLSLMGIKQARRDIQLLKEYAKSERDRLNAEREAGES